MTKTTGLAAFTRKGTPASQEQPEAAPMRHRGRAKGNVVALTVRLPKTDWERIHQLAVVEGVSIQALAVEGLSKVFIGKGLPKLSC